MSTNIASTAKGISLDFIAASGTAKDINKTFRAGHLFPGRERWPGLLVCARQGAWQRRVYG
jgi:hypothetical protein